MSRIKLSRQKGWRMPAGAVKVDRSTRWGNPYQAGQDGDGSRAYLTTLFDDFVHRPEQAKFCEDVKKELKGKTLACWCPTDGPCHADILLKIANT